MSKDVAKVLCEWAYPYKRTAGIKISCPLSWNRKPKLLSLSLDSSFPQQNVPLEKVEISILFNYSLTYLLSTSSFWDVELSSINWVPWKVYYPCAGTAVQLGRIFLFASYAHVQWFVTIQKGERNCFVTPYRIAFLYRPLWWNFLDAKTTSVERRFPQCPSLGVDSGGRAAHNDQVEVLWPVEAVCLGQACWNCLLSNAAFTFTLPGMLPHCCPFSITGWWKALFHFINGKSY